MRETARLFAMAHTAGSDAAIAGLEAKYFYRTWRPRTSIPGAAKDGNPGTTPDPTWAPRLTVNHPEYPSGHAFYSTAVTDAVAAFFGTDKGGRRPRPSDRQARDGETLPPSPPVVNG